MRPTDLEFLTLASDPRVAPAGDRVAFVVTTTDLAANQYRSAVWLAPLDGAGPAERLTAGAARDGRPRWSPDGRRLAFTSHRAEAGSQLFVLPLGGGEPGAVATLAEEIEELEWSPDGRWLAFTARRRDESVFGPAKDADRPPRRITRLGWRYNGTGWLTDRPRCLWVVPADGTAAPRVVAHGAGDVAPQFSWAPDSARLAFVQGRHDDADRDGANQLWVVPTDGGDPSALTEAGWSCSTPSWSPDGTTVAYYRTPPLVSAVVADLRLVRVADGTDTRIEAAAALDRSRPVTSATRLVWHEGELLHVVEDRGAAHLYRTPDRRVAGGDRVITGFDAVGSAIVAIVSEPTVPSRVLTIAADGTERELARFDARFATAAPERFTAVSADGTEVEAWLVRPAGFDPARSYPLLVNIHGGPYASYGYGFFDEFQVQAEAGYAVVYANPRGSAGYGQAWGQAIFGPACTPPGSGWGGVDSEDIHAVVDRALADHSFLDPSRVGVLGGSYGGYLTSWLIGHTDRFAAACSERAVNNVLSMTHTSDIGWWFNTAYAGVGSDQPDELLSISPVTYADAITTPLLIIHSENDFRCPIEQAEDLFIRLRRRGHDVEMVRFPGEDHELTRSGSPMHRRVRFELLLEFFDRYLQPSVTPG